ncbi:LOW QUALITY PROTEIN: hypothetical protein HID58_045272 [Brassica napus]|uniref:Malic enzyme n=2 Tax=Brassica napus TaxID=3708 RepID=A0ABQ8AT20_BRANA|nr:LOW QUALITY PROTEIN: hypothetical protein HID58_045272 [Brassica napus]
MGTEVPCDVVSDNRSGVGGGISDVYGEDLATLDQLVTPWVSSVARNLIVEMKLCYSGYSLMRDPRYNKGLAFTDKERDAHYLTGLLPPVVLSQEVQERKLMHNLRQYTVPLQRYMALMDLQERNERLFYKLLIDNVEELLPVVYTPTVGEACQKYGSIFRKPQGLYISLKEKGKILEVLKNWPQRGIQCLPITIDVGTNNEKLLNDEFYIGLKQRRATGQEYAEFLHEFMCAFEDFANHNAFDLLSKYSTSHLVFNDDIQGTASVVLAGLIAAQKVLGKSLADHTFLFLGAGEAGTGIAELIALKISKETGAPIDETRKKIWLVDSKGLIVSSRKESLQHFKQPWAHEHEPVKNLIGAVNAIKPTVLIGTSGVGQTFTQEVVEAMATNNETPLILALSNPTSQAECTAEQAYTWTKGRAIFGSGSPFDPVEIGIEPATSKRSGEVCRELHLRLRNPHSFKILFKEGGCGTFVPLFLNLISSVRQYNRQMQQAAEAAEAAPRVDPLQAAQSPVDEMMRHAYVDPNDPTKIYLQQPAGESQLRRRAYHSSVGEH